MRFWSGAPGPAAGGGPLYTDPALFGRPPSYIERSRHALFVNILHVLHTPYVPRAIGKAHRYRAAHRWDYLKAAGQRVPENSGGSGESRGGLSDNEKHDAASQRRLHALLQRLDALDGAPVMLPGGEKRSNYLGGLVDSHRSVFPAVGGGENGEALTTDGVLLSLTAGAEAASTAAADARSGGKSDSFLEWKAHQSAALRGCFEAGYDSYTNFGKEWAQQTERELEGCGGGGSDGESGHGAADSSDSDIADDPDAALPPEWVPQRQPPPAGSRPLNAGQQSPVDALFRKLDAGEQALYLLHGQPGSGKTWTVAAMSEELARRGAAHFAVSYMWSAVLQLDVLCKKASVHRLAAMGRVRVLTAAVVETREYDRFVDRMCKELGMTPTEAQNLRVLFIDEISTTHPYLFEILDRALRALRRTPGEPFGGVSIVAVGDFFQLGPYGNVQPLAGGLASLHHGQARVPPLVSQSHDAHVTFGRFERWELKAQERASGDPEHCQLLNDLRAAALPGRSGRPITERVLQYLKQRMLTADVLRLDPAFEDAVIAVSTNLERAVLAKRQIIRWAERHGQPVFRWVLTCRPLPDTDGGGAGGGGSGGNGGGGVNMRDVERCVELGVKTLEVYWALGMPMVLSDHAKDKIRERHMACKGARGQAHAMFPAPPQVENDAGISWCLPDGGVNPAAAGHIFTIPQPERLVLNMVPNSGGGEPYLLPVGATYSASPFDKFKVSMIGGDINDRWQPVKVHGAEQGFTVTYEKLQGLTAERLIALLNNARGAKLGTLTMQKLNVALSRVRDKSHLAIWPATDEELQYLTKLEWPPELRAWLANYSPESQGSRRWLGDRLVLPKTFPPKAFGNSGLRALGLKDAQACGQKAWFDSHGQGDGR